MTLYQIARRPFFNSFFNDIHEQESEHQNKNCVCIPVNISDFSENYLLEFAAPGYDKNNFKIEIADNHLTVKVEQEQTQEEQENYTRREFRYGNFERSFRLPKTVDTEKINAEYSNGILKIVVPKKPEEAKLSKQIMIN